MDKNINIDILDICSKSSYDTFRLLDKTFSIKEYCYAQNLYKLFLTACCCLYITDNNYNIDIRKTVNDVNRFWKDEMPFSFTIFVYDVYQEYMSEMPYIGHESEKRISIGNKICKYIFSGVTYPSRYDLSANLYEMLDNTINTIDYLLNDNEKEKNNKCNNSIKDKSTKNTKCLEYNEVSSFFPSIFFGSEDLWFQKAWHILTKYNMTSYNDDIERWRVILYAVCLGMIYIDFFKIAIDEDTGYEEIYDELRSSFDDEAEIGFIYAKLSNEEYYPGFHQSMLELTDSYRQSIMNTLNHELDDYLICIGMYYSSVGDNIYYDNNIEDLDTDENIKINVEDYNKYWKSITDNLKDIGGESMDFENLLRGIGWIESGVDRISSLEY